MIKFFSVILGLLLLTLTVFTPVISAYDNFRGEEVATLRSEETLDKDYFSWGERVVLSGTVDGDAYLAGGNVVVDGVVNGDLLVAGGNIKVSGKVTGDVRSAGGNINIAGKVGGNITTLGGNIDIEKGAKVGGSLVAAGGNIKIFGPLGRGATIGAGSVTLDSSVNGDVLAGVERLNLYSGAKIDGDLTYISSEKASLAKDASVSGKVTQQAPPKPTLAEEGLGKILSLGWEVYWLLATLLLGILAALFAPNHLLKTANIINDKTLLSLGVGFLGVTLIPVLVLILFITIIGVPIALMLLALYLFLWLFAIIPTALFLGQKILTRLGQKQNLILTLALGLLLLAVLELIPMVGGTIALVAMLLGIGGLILAKRDLYLELRSKKQL